MRYTEKERPGNASNDNTAHMPTARSSEDLTEPHSNATHPHKRQNNLTNGHTPSRIKSTHTHLTYTGTGPHAPGHWATQCLHTQSVTTCRRWTQMCRHASTSLSRREYQSHSVAFFTYRPLIRSNSMFCAEKMQEISTCGPVEYCPTQAVPFAPPPPPHRRSAQQ